MNAVGRSHHPKYPDVFLYRYWRLHTLAHLINHFWSKSFSQFAVQYFVHLNIEAKNRFLIVWQIGLSDRHWRHRYK